MCGFEKIMPMAPRKGPWERTTSTGLNQMSGLERTIVFVETIKESLGIYLTIYEGNAQTVRTSEADLSI